MQRYFLPFLISLALAGPALAQNDSVYMLQLGSFQSEQEAEAHWGTIKGKYPNVLSNIAAQVRSVSLPPDNLTVYRTQAGPLISRDTAERLCAQLTQTGDECFVVETAMVAMPDVLPQNTIANTVQQVPAALNQAASDVPQFLSQTRQNATDRLETLPIPSAEIPQDPANLALEAMPRFQAPAIQAPTIQAQVPAAPQPRQARTLFGELFGEESDVLFNENQTQPAPQTTISATAPTIPDLPALAPPAAAIAQEVTLIEPSVTNTNPLAGLRLPAPPPPETITRGIQADAPVMEITPKLVSPAPQTIRPQSVAASMPSPFQRAQAADLARIQPQQALPTIQETQVGGNVAVAEAIPVPLSEQRPTQQIQPVSVARHYTAEELASRGLPSQELSERTFWAQVSMFDSQQTALAFWDAFRRQNPTFPAVRVRVTQPFAKSRTGDPRVSLRIGPFDGPGMVGVLCKALPQSNAICGAVADLGTSTAANQPRYRGPQNRYAARFSSGAKPGGVSGYYVQLGAFGTPGEAEFAWDQLQKQVPALLGSLRSDIAAPNLTSSARRSFRLRTGPYIRVSSATELCGNLKERGIRCLVVGGR